MIISPASQPTDRQPSPDAASVWPASALAAPDGDLTVGAVALTEVAERFGTPVHILDEDEVRRRCRAYRSAFTDADVVYTAEAFLCRAMAHRVDREGLGLAVRSAAELQLAVTAGVPPGRIVVHGDARSPQDLRAALRLGAGRIVVDSGGEIARLAAEVSTGSRHRILLRVSPGVAAGSHAAMRTGGDDQRFRLSISDGSARHAAARLLNQPDLELVGLHCHLGSQIDTVKPYLLAVRRLVGLLARIRRQHGIALPEMNLGGGHAVAHRPGETTLDITTLAARIRAELAESCAAADLPVPRLTVEPGRGIVARAGVALYRVLTVRRSGGRLLVVVDADTGDGPGPALHGVRYAPRLVGRRSAAGAVTATVVGRRCEAADTVADDVELPGDTRPGDLMAVPVTGAYHPATASCCTLAGCPPLVAVTGGRARLLVRRASPTDTGNRDTGL